MNATLSPYNTLADVRNANRQAGYHFFDADTLRFFRGRIIGQLVAGRYFITSEQFVAPYEAPAPRRYTIRYANDDATIDTVGDFQQYATLADARKALRSLTA